MVVLAVCQPYYWPYFKYKQTQLILSLVRHTGILHQFKTGIAKKKKYVIYRLGRSG